MKYYLYNEDFKDFEIGEFPYDKAHSALGEYHNLMPEGYYGNWYDPICSHQWRSMDGSWLITSNGQKHFLEQNRGDYSTGYFASLSAFLILRGMIYTSYTFEMDIKLFDISKYCGMVFNYISSRNYYSVSLKGDEIILYHCNQDNIDYIAGEKCNFSDLETYHVEIEVNNSFKVLVNDKEIFNCNIEIFPSKCGVIGKGACRYSDIRVSMINKDLKKQKELCKLAETKLLEKRKQYPKLNVIRTIDLKNFGTGRQMRVAHKADGQIFFIFAQHQKRIMRDSFAHISCLTAIDLNGGVLWQMGEANNGSDNTLISCDLPFQVTDINNDGKDELIYARDFEVIIIDAESGQLIKKMPTPIVTEGPFLRLNVDAIRLADFSQKGYQSDFILKDRYKNVWAFDYDFNLLWHYNHKNTGHFPYIHDFNNDGFDEMFVGYDYVDHQGNIVWSLPINNDHTDEIIYVSTHPKNDKKLYLASGNEGFNIVNLKGEIEKSVNVGHAQRISIADYTNEIDGLEICVTSFWGSGGIIYLFDCNGNLLKEKEMMTNGNIITPVNYDGENTFILSNAHPTDGGLLNSDLEQVILFPDDGHPTLCSEVLDIDNDGVDEILCWNQEKLWIYKAEKFVTDNKFAKYPDNAFSNYRGEYLIKLLDD